ncbi:galactosyl transferase GMA12/MNN10 family protein [Acanthamoeba castellanii str. Neff]|uniref:Galactosyl transferase GMA12/MNN10 family protein n=1 Tax=Acanthamoeba castellanii (strain ATCC 30010 / Neff) TaxID=1257118 RepID=L8GV84_ACACF|nr:galactosyl transferase GMA12/MNN10 family protein [Acanthamoeba castellanii str. Neff]ELR16001.1 galactosyl transferase GMA12/MNN10 family protein [Acanthamoeba castellanii str. Neff]
MLTTLGRKEAIMACLAKKMWKQKKKQKQQRGRKQSKQKKNRKRRRKSPKKEKREMRGLSSTRTERVAPPPRSTCNTTPRSTRAANSSMARATAPASRDVSIKNKMLYAKLHGYDFEWWVTAYKAPQGQTPRPPIWTKTAFLLDVLAGTEGEGDCDYDWLLWLDCDSLVARYEFTIKHITGQYFNDQHKQIVLSKDLNGFNSGIMALRCSAWNLALFRRIWDSKQYINDVWAEQRGLIAFYNSDSDVKSRVAEVPQDQMQYVKGAPARKVPEGAAGEFDIFVVHFAGFWGAKDKWMAQYYPDIMKHGSWMKPPLD